MAYIPATYRHLSNVMTCQGKSLSFFPVSMPSVSREAAVFHILSKVQDILSTIPLTTIHKIYAVVQEVERSSTNWKIGRLIPVFSSPHVDVNLG